MGLVLLLIFKSPWSFGFALLPEIKSAAWDCEEGQLKGRNNNIVIAELYIPHLSGFLVWTHRLLVTLLLYRPPWSKPLDQVLSVSLPHPSAFWEDWFSTLVSTWSKTTPGPLLSALANTSFCVSAPLVKLNLTTQELGFIHLCQSSHCPALILAYCMWLHRDGPPDPFSRKDACLKTSIKMALDHCQQPITALTFSPNCLKSVCFQFSPVFVPISKSGAEMIHF